MTNTLLATRAPVVVCPAMHTEMWEHPSVVENIAVLRDRGVHIVDPAVGRLAGGDVGAGRLADPDTIVAAVRRVLGPRDLDDVRVVVSAGGTREPIDAVRVIANRSSGKQGYAVAAEAAERGATVTLVSTVGLPAPTGVDVIRVETAAEMQEAMTRAAIDHDVIVMAAAVADFRPATVAAGKMKKRDGAPQITLGADARHPRRPRRHETARPGARRLRRRDRRPRRQCDREAGREAGRSDRRQ